jgi:hypothetical protein
VGVGFVPPPLTVTATANACPDVMLLEPGITVTVGRIRDITVATADPEALL